MVLEEKRGEVTEPFRLDVKVPGGPYESGKPGGPRGVELRRGEEPCPPEVSDGLLYVSP